MIARRRCSLALLCLLVGPAILCAQSSSAISNPSSAAPPVTIAASEMPNAPSVAPPDDEATTSPGAGEGEGISAKAAARNARDINAVPTLAASFGQTIGSLRIFVYAQDRSAQVPALFYYYPIGHTGWFRYDYQMQFVPLYALHQPKYYNYDSVATTTARRTTFGAGFLPVGARMIIDPRQKLQISYSANIGFIYFTRRILSEGATRFNINLQFGNSFQYPVSKNGSVIVGYAVNHLSNSNIHLKNPGLDSNLVYAQYLFHIRKKGQAGERPS